MGYRIGVGIGLSLVGVFIMALASSNSARCLFQFGVGMLIAGVSLLVVSSIIIGEEEGG